MSQDPTQPPRQHPGEGVPAPHQGPQPEHPTWIEPAPPAAEDSVADRLQTVIDAAERAADAIRADAEEQARRHLAEAQQKADRMTAERVRMISQLTDDLIEHASVVKEHSQSMVATLEQAIKVASSRLDELDAGGAPAEAARPTPVAAPAPAPGALSGGTSQPTHEAPAPAAPPPTPAEPEAADDQRHSGTAAPVAAPQPEFEADTPASPASQPEAPRAEAPAPAEASAATPAPDTAGAAPASEPAPAEPAEAPPTEALLRATQLAIAGESRDSVGDAIRRDFGVDPEPVLAQVFED